MVYFCEGTHVAGRSARYVSRRRGMFAIRRLTVVVIFVNKPATISMMSPTGIELISYCCPPANLPLKECLEGCLDRVRTSSLAKLCMWPKSLTFMRLGELATDPFRDNVERCVGSRRGDGGGIALSVAE